MKPTRFNRFSAIAALSILPGCLFAADRVRNNTANPLIDQAAWGDGVSGTPGASDRAVWNGTSVGGGTTLGGDVAWGGILISSATPVSGPSFSNTLNPSAFTLTLGASGIDLNDGESTNRGITFESNTKLDLSANQTWKLGLGQSSANITASSVISGIGSLEITRDVAGVNYAQLGGANTFSGGLTIGAGSWVRVASSSINNLTAVTSGPTGTGNLTLNDGSLLSSASGTGYVIASPQINLLGNVTLNQSTGGTGRLQIAGTWDLGGASRTLTIEKPATSLGSGQEGLGFATPTGFSSPKIQNGSLTLTTVSGTAANKAVVRFTTTTFDSNGRLTVDDGVAITSQNGSFFATGANSPALVLNANVSRGGGLLQLGDGSATMRSAQVYSLSGGGAISASNTTTTPAQTGVFTINNGNGAVFSGTISEGGTGIIAVTKSGAGSQTLSGTNTYTGKTTVSTGTLQFAKQVSLYNNTPGSWTDTNLQVDSNAVLAFNVGGSGEFTSSDIATLAALGTASGGFKSGSRIGLDTTNAGGTLTYSNVLANPNAGANALGLRKLGTGTLVLDQANTYTSGTIVEGGALKITQPAGLGTGAVVVNAGTTLDVDFSGLGVAGQYSRTTTGTGTINATPPNASQFGFSSGTLTGFAGTINARQGIANNARVDINGMLGSGTILNIESGATARFALSAGIYSGITINVTGQGGSGPGALRLQDNTLDAACAVNLLGDASIGGFTVTSTIDAVIADSGNGYSLTKSGDSTLVLTALNTYTGNTSVSGGTLRISQPYLANSSGIVIGATAILDLNFDESGGAVSDTVSTLTIGGVQQPAGIYGATGSGATTINDTNFAGIGTLTVTNGPSAGSFATWANSNGIPGQPFGGDFDNDGISNGVEYALGKSPTVSSQPAGVLLGDTITFTKGTDAITNGDVSWVIETSTTLAEGSWSPEVTQPPGNAAATIAYTFTPGTPVKKFARLKVVQVTP